ncbi:hypothetical protein MTR_7g106390 [Medicago truncatula]|uniref:Uncharacterized protein n=1 Tax=Medicago truncatula TaxID=3880 RepID=A0A072U3E5_MEDTR|nr:hypothetical protein MTR_7g106390 [Medicago truncatula]
MRRIPPVPPSSSIPSSSSESSTNNPVIDSDSLFMGHQAVNIQTNESRIAGNVESMNSTTELELLAPLPPSMEGKNDVDKGEGSNDKQTQTLQQLKKEDETGTGSTLSGVHFDVEACRKALAKMIIVDELPFKFLEGEEFRYFVSVVQPRFPIPSRISVAIDCWDILTKEKHKLRSMFRRGD